MKLNIIITFLLCYFPIIVSGQTKVRIGVFVYPEMELQDFAGPTDVFIKANRLTDKQYQIYLFSQDGNQIKTEQGLVCITPSYSFEDLPLVDLILLPGAPSDAVKALSEQVQIKQFLIQKNQEGVKLASVCTGAYLLGYAGLLDNRKFTTHFMQANNMQDQFVKAVLVKDVRLVDSQEVLTASGITSGIDLSLYLVEKYSGKPIQEKIAKMMQYQYSVNQEWPKI
ncbi:DJ-1/PfpI family protein [Myroides albus]|uniref:DJ-1/PfpI family protein n=1 Tax=Myroides albus TaxID=2562892 RepID=UPI002159B286|nr:DJ-1/PfpI family protein [Myroides albus]UVD79056.1 DJ-1/PfpI family protein [Myroides albus]